MGFINLDPDWGMADVRSTKKKAECLSDSLTIRAALEVIQKYGEGPTMTLRMIEQLAERLER